MLIDIAVTTGHLPAVMFTRDRMTPTARAIYQGVNLPALASIPGNELGLVLVNEDWLLRTMSGANQWSVVAVRAVLSHEIAHLLQYRQETHAVLNQQGCELHADFMAGFMSRPPVPDDREPLLQGLTKLLTGSLEHGTEPQRTAAVLAGMRSHHLSYDGAYQQGAQVAAQLESTWFSNPARIPLGAPAELVLIAGNESWDSDHYGPLMRGARTYQNIGDRTIDVEVVWVVRMHRRDHREPEQVSARSARGTIKPGEITRFTQCSRYYSADWVIGADVRVFVIFPRPSLEAPPTLGSSDKHC